MTDSKPAIGPDQHSRPVASPISRPARAELPAAPPAATPLLDPASARLSTPLSVHPDHRAQRGSAPEGLSWPGTRSPVAPRLRQHLTNERHQTGSTLRVRFTLPDSTVPAAVFLGRAFPATFKQPVLTSLEFRPPPEFSPADPSRTGEPADSSHGLCFPTALQGTAVHISRACQPALFRLQGLLTLLAAYSPRTRAVLVSCRRRPWDSPSGALPSRAVSGSFDPDEPTYRFADR